MAQVLVASYTGIQKAEKDLWNQAMILMTPEQLSSVCSLHEQETLVYE